MRKHVAVSVARILHLLDSAACARDWPTDKGQDGKHRKPQESLAQGVNHCQHLSKAFELARLLLQGPARSRALRPFGGVGGLVTHSRPADWQNALAITVTCVGELRGCDGGQSSDNPSHKLLHGGRFGA